ncbi:unnamed protein product [Somion occarium]|uniref:F-box domain-containing protein n=1 Tax=Somion occarium TaxID=3059160 RepID=A0ABP1DYM6_9APHY
MRVDFTDDEGFPIGFGVKQSSIYLTDLSALVRKLPNLHTLRLEGVHWNGCGDTERDKIGTNSSFKRLILVDMERSISTLAFIQLLSLLPGLKDLRHYRVALSCRFPGTSYEGDADTMNPLLSTTGTEEDLSTNVPILSILRSRPPSPPSEHWIPSELKLETLSVYIDAESLLHVITPSMLSDLHTLRTLYVFDRGLWGVTSIIVPTLKNLMFDVDLHGTADWEDLDLSGCTELRYLTLLQPWNSAPPDFDFPPPSIPVENISSSLDDTEGAVYPYRPPSLPSSAGDIPPSHTGADADSDSEVASDLEDDDDDPTFDHSVHTILARAPPNVEELSIVTYWRKYIDPIRHILSSWNWTALSNLLTENRPTSRLSAFATSLVMKVRVKRRKLGLKAWMRRCIILLRPDCLGLTKGAS